MQAKKQHPPISDATTLRQSGRDTRLTKIRLNPQIKSYFTSPDGTIMRHLRAVVVHYIDYTDAVSILAESMAIGLAPWPRSKGELMDIIHKHVQTYGQTSGIDHSEVNRHTIYAAKRLVADLLPDYFPMLARPDLPPPPGFRKDLVQGRPSPLPPAVVYCQYTRADITAYRPSPGHEGRRPKACLQKPKYAVITEEGVKMLCSWHLKHLLNSSPTLEYQEIPTAKKRRSIV